VEANSSADGNKEQSPGDETSSCRGLCWREGRKDGRTWAPAAQLKATGTPLTSEGCEPAPHEEAGRPGMAVSSCLKERTTCYYYFLSRACSNGASGNGFKLKEGRFRLDIRKSFLQ